MRMVVVVNYLNVIIRKVIDFCTLRVESESGELERWSANLFAGLFEVVGIEMQIAEGVDEFAGGQAGDLGDHAGEQGVAGDVEGDAEEEVGAALV